MIKITSEEKLCISPTLLFIASYFALWISNSHTYYNVYDAIELNVEKNKKVARII